VHVGDVGFRFQPDVAGARQVEQRAQGGGSGGGVETVEVVFQGGDVAVYGLSPRTSGVAAPGGRRPRAILA